jgi:hypothetical protein
MSRPRTRSGCAGAPRAAALFGLLVSAADSATAARSCGFQDPLTGARGGHALPSRHQIVHERARLRADTVLRLSRVRVSAGQVKMGADRGCSLCRAAQGCGNNSGHFLCDQPWFLRAHFCDGPHQGERPPLPCHCLPLLPRSSHHSPVLFPVLAFPPTLPLVPKP